MTRRHGLYSDKRLVIVGQIEARGVDPQVATQFRVPPAFAGCEGLIKREGIGIALPPVDALQITASLHQSMDHLQFTSAQTGRLERHSDAPEFGKPLGQIWRHVQVRWDAAL